MSVRAHRRVKIPFPNAPRGQCSWCNRDEVPGGARMHPECDVEMRCLDDSRLLRKTVFDRDGGECAGCGEVDAHPDGQWDADHIVRLADGGGTGLDNVQTLCRAHCHKEKTRAENRAQARGLPIPHWTPPSWRRHLGWLVPPLRWLGRHPRVSLALVIGSYVYALVTWPIGTVAVTQDSALLAYAAGTFLAAHIALGFIAVVGFTAASAIASRLARRRYKVRDDVRQAVAAAVKAPANDPRLITVTRWAGIARPYEITIRYPATFRDSDPAQRAGVEDAVGARLGCRVQGKWTTHKRVVLVSRMPAYPDVAAYPGRDPELPKHKLSLGFTPAGPFTVDVKQFPHTLVCGETGSGKTCMIRVVIAEVLAAHRVLVDGGQTVVNIADPKRIEFVGFRGMAGVGTVATEIGDILDLIAAEEREMHGRYALIEAALAIGDSEPEMPARYLVIDEAASLVKMAARVWKAPAPGSTKGNAGDPPVMEHIANLSRLGRSANVHLVTGLQRPDIRFMEGDSRDQYGVRYALGQLSRIGAEMMFGDQQTGTKTPNVSGRATAAAGEDAVEVQTYWLPKPESTDPADRALIARHFPPRKIAVP